MFQRVGRLRRGLERWRNRRGGFSLVALMGAMRFHVAPAAKTVHAGNRISTGPDAADNCIGNVRTGERMQTRSERGTYVVDVQFN